MWSAVAKQCSRHVAIVAANTGGGGVVGSE